ncbi:hypothetical protein NDU88_002132 [Pleurodeles waltl]|uniref:Uncharacterized protein n=1 Tax=Pleurodeles waltl TaxID=8319 RepID=A0AAV7M004_PLEWA|nr:hypothetical protein NDU88_002132 [Pleurodeles waltl]
MQPVAVSEASQSGPNTAGLPSTGPRSKSVVAGSPHSTARVDTQEKCEKLNQDKEVTHQAIRIVLSPTEVSSNLEHQQPDQAVRSSVACRIRPPVKKLGQTCASAGVRGPI